MNNPVSIEVGGSAALSPRHRVAASPRLVGDEVQVASLFMLPGILAGLTNSAIADSNGEHLYFYHSDHLGTPLFLTDTDGVVVWRGEYLPFGEVFIEDRDPDGDGTEVEQPFRFPGQYEDAETGLYYNYFRDYDPQLGRYVEFVGKPTPGEPNIYVYTNANPINLIDPLGLAPLPGYEDYWWNPGNFKFHGNWGGPGLTGGYEGSWDQLTWEERRNTSCPVDNMDDLFKQHDIFYGQAREDYYLYLGIYPTASPYDRYLARNRMNKEFRIADRVLADDLIGLNDPTVPWKRDIAAWYFGIVGY